MMLLTTQPIFVQLGLNEGDTFRSSTEYFLGHILQIKNAQSLHLHSD